MFHPHQKVGSATTGNTALFLVSTKLAIGTRGSTDARRTETSTVHSAPRFRFGLPARTTTTTEGERAERPNRTGFIARVTTARYRHRPRNTYQRHITSLMRTPRPLEQARQHRTDVVGGFTNCSDRLCTAGLVLIEQRDDRASRER